MINKTTLLISIFLLSIFSSWVADGLQVIILPFFNENKWSLSMISVMVFAWFYLLNYVGKIADLSMTHQIIEPDKGLMPKFSYLVYGLSPECIVDRSSETEGYLNIRLKDKDKDKNKNLSNWKVFTNDDNTDTVKYIVEIKDSRFSCNLQQIVCAIAANKHLKHVVLLGSADSRGRDGNQTDGSHKTVKDICDYLNFLFGRKINFHYHDEAFDFENNCEVFQNTSDVYKKITNGYYENKSETKQCFFKKLLTKLSNRVVEDEQILFDITGGTKCISAVFGTLSVLNGSYLQYITNSHKSKIYQCKVNVSKM